MECIELAKQLHGLQTVESVMKKLSIARSTAIKYVHFLNKKGFVQKSGGGKQKRFYRISPLHIKRIGNPGLYETINRNSRIKLSEYYEHRIIAKKVTVEMAIARAIATGEFRTILASLSLFNKVRNWAELYSYAKQWDCRNKIGALYDLARVNIKVRAMDTKTRRALLRAKDNSRYIIMNMKSNDFKNIEKRWNVYLPFNAADMRRLRE